MSSKETDKKIENRPTIERNSNMMDKQLMNLSCPFTWNMEDVIKDHRKLLEKKTDDRLEMVQDIKDNFPEFVLIYHMLLCYEHIIMNNDPESALQCTNKVALILADIREKERLKYVENVLRHIFIATKCHVLKKFGQLTEIDKLLKKIPTVKNMNRTELAMLNGCQCLAWSLYYVPNNAMAIDYAKRAIELDGLNGKWYFLLGKNYRRFRRMHQRLYVKADENEISLFERAYRLSKNVLFGVTLATVYRESNNRYLATQIYEEVYALQPSSCFVQLKLALGFIQGNNKLLAKRCLEYVGTKMPYSVVYEHYMGIYQEKCNEDFQAALPYYKSTTEKCNFGGEWQYIRCRKHVERDWDPLPYMMELLNKYANGFDRIIQEINIQLGSYYLFIIDDILPACLHLTKVIKVHPDSHLLKNHYPVFNPHPGRGINIYQSLSVKVQFVLEHNTTKYDDDTIAMLKDTLQLCYANCEY